MDSFKVYDKEAVEVEDAMLVLEQQKELPAHLKERLGKVYERHAGDMEEIEPCGAKQLNNMHKITQTLLQNIVDDNHEIRSDATMRDVSSAVGSMTSLLRLFSSTQDKIDSSKAVDEIFNATTSAISKLTLEQQKPFWREIKRPEWGMHAPALDGCGDDE